MDISNRDWTFVYSEGHSMLWNELWFQAFTRHPEIPGSFNEILYINTNGLQTCFVPRSELDRVREAGRIFFRAHVRRVFESAIQQCATDFEDFWSEFKMIDCSRASNETLLEIFNRFCELWEWMLGYYQVSGGRCFPLLEEYAKREELRLLPINERESAYATVLSSPEFDRMECEQRDLWTLIEKKKTDRVHLLQHAKRYAYAYLCLYHENAAISALHEKIAALKKQNKSRREYLAEQTRQKNNLLRRQKLILRRLRGKKKLLEIIAFLRSQGKLRFEYKEWAFGAEFKFVSLFEEIARRIGIPIEEYMGSYRVEDTRRFLLRGRRLGLQDRQRRRALFVFLCMGKRNFFFSGSSAKHIQQQLVPDNRRERSVNGVVANTGRANGRVRIILPKSFEHLDRAVKSFRTGEILMTTMTQPSLLPIMKKAAAIVTDQGGITSHAAVLSRELGIPCIIGTFRATQIFRDGDRVTVDAHTGIVTRM